MQLKMGALRKTLNRQRHRQTAGLVGGGETTVTLKGNGHGGRNQEMALASLLRAATGLNRLLDISQRRHRWP